jgi:hypothetical protein
MSPESTRRPRVAGPAGALLAALCWAAPAAAADHCIAAGNVAQLQQALTSAAASPEDDTVRLEVGSYNVGAGLEYPLAPGFRGGALRLLGGFQAGCAAPVNVATPDDTVLDGFNAAAARIDFSSTGEYLELSKFSLRRSRGLLVFEQGLPCRGPRAALRAHRLRIEDGQVGSNGAGLNIATRCLSVRVENLIARRNTGAGLSVFAIAPDVRVEVVHSTLTENVTGLRYIGVLDTAPGMARVANTILRFNTGDDVLAPGAGVSLRNSMFLTASGSISTIDTVAGDPQLDVDGRPAAGSPAIGGGAHAIPGGMPQFGFDTVVRPAGAAPDVGAYESGPFALPAISVTTASDGNGAGTLRSAIVQANATAGRQRISFDIPGTSCHKALLLASPLPTITDGLVIDGYTQQGTDGRINTSLHGYDGDPCIQIHNADPVGNPLSHAITIETTATDDAVILRGLAFGGFGLPGDAATGAVVVRDGRGHRIEANQFSGAVGILTLADNVRDVVVSGPVRNMNIGGLDPARRNYFGAGGVTIRNDARVVEVVGNLMGTDKTGTQASPVPGNYGVHITGSPNNLVLANTMSGLNLTGVQINGDASDNTRIQDNRIGIAASGEAALGNGGAGVVVADAASGTFVAGNTIAHNGSHGVQIRAGLGHRIENNRLHDNAGLGIELGDDGATPNDDDADPLAGLLPNRVLNAPVLAAAGGTPAQSQISGVLSSIAGDYVVEFFASPGCDASGRGEGKAPVGSVAVPIVGSGQVATGFQVDVFPGVSLAGQFITATARDADGNTSEFSACLAYAAIGALFRDGFESTP